MDRSIILIVLTTLVGSVVLSGCTAQALPQATAQEVRSPADEAAHAWAPDAKLVTIAGLEGRWAGGMQAHASWHGQESQAKSDAHVGDGRCEFWVFRYASSSQDLAYEVVVDRDGKLIGAEEDERDEDDVPLGAYNVGSDAAASKAREASDGIREAESRSNGGSVLVLDRDDDHENPVWVVMAGAQDSEEGWIGGMVVIDAVTGEVLAEMDFSDWGGSWGSWGSWGTYGGHGSGTYGTGGSSGHDPGSYGPATTGHGAGASHGGPDGEDSPVEPVRALVPGA